MAVGVRTNLSGLAALADLRSATVNVVSTMKRLQTGLKITSAKESPGLLVLSQTLSAKIATVEFSQGEMSRVSSILQTVEDTIAQVSNLLEQLKSLAEQSASSSLSDAERAANQESANEIYDQIRQLVRGTTYLNSPLIRGGFGNVIANVSWMIGGTGLPTLSVERFFNVAGVNLQGWATWATVPLPEDAPGYAEVGLSTYFWDSALTPWDIGQGSLASVQISYQAGVATAVLRYSGNANSLFTETIYNVGTGVQVLDFENLGVKFYADDPDIGFYVQGSVVIDLQRQPSEFLAGGLQDTERFSFYLPNIEPENLLGEGPGGALFTFDISDQALAATAVEVIEVAINYVDQVRAQIGGVRQGVDTRTNTLENMVQMLYAARASVRDADIERETLELTKWQVIQQSALAMVAQARLQPQLILQLFAV